MKRIAALLLSLATAVPAFCQSPHDGAGSPDLLQHIAAWERVQAQRGTPEDHARAGFLLGYLHGVLGVNAQNTDLWRTMAGRRDGREPVVSDEAVRVGTLFVPLEALPDAVGVEQSLRAVKTYLQRQPQPSRAPWHALVQSALFDAYAQPAGAAPAR
jgi:hypothetical protein